MIVEPSFVSCFFLLLWRTSLCLNIIYFNVLYQAFSTYYKGGFEQKMTKREASLVLGIR